MAFQRPFNKPQTGLASLGAEESIDANADGRVTFWEFARAVADGPAATTLQNFVTRFRDRAAKQSLLWSGMHIPPNRPCVVVLELPATLLIGSYQSPAHSRLRLGWWLHDAPWL